MILFFFFLLRCRCYTLIHITRHFHNYTTLWARRTHSPHIRGNVLCIHFSTKFSLSFYLCALFCVYCTHIVFWIENCTESRASQRYENIFNVQMGWTISILGCGWAERDEEGWKFISSIKLYSHMQFNRFLFIHDFRARYIYIWTTQLLTLNESTEMVCKVVREYSFVRTFICMNLCVCALSSRECILLCSWWNFEIQVQQMYCCCWLLYWKLIYTFFGYSPRFVSLSFCLSL